MKVKEIFVYREHFGDLVSYVWNDETFDCDAWAECVKKRNEGAVLKEVLRCNTWWNINMLVPKSLLDRNEFKKEEVFTVQILLSVIDS